MTGVPEGHTGAHLRNLWGRRALAAVWVPLLAVAVLHYASPHHAYGVHDVARRLFYLPILFGGTLGGPLGGLAVAGVVLLAYTPHAFLMESVDPASTVQKSLEMGFYGVLGLVSGAIAARSSREQQRQRELTAQLERAARLEALGQLTAGLAHEIRNPLHAMRGSAEILLEGVPEGAEEREVGRALLTEIDRLSGVLRRFLDYARRRDPELAPVDLGVVVERVSELLRAQAGRQSVTLDTKARSVTLQADLDQLVQVILGLGLNALQALDGGGRIRLEIVEREGLAGIAVCNDGEPIPEELLERVFDPFVTGREDGTGLGLSVAWRIIDAHGGRIEVENEDGVCFRVWLPRCGVVDRGTPGAGSLR